MKPSNARFEVLREIGEGTEVPLNKSIRKSYIGDIHDLEAYNNYVRQENDFEQSSVGKIEAVDDSPPMICTNDLSTDDLDGYDPQSEEYIKICSNIFNKYATNAKRWCKEQYNVFAKVNAPNINYYIVLTPYRKKSGMTISEVARHVKRNWRPIRLLITRETRKEDGSPINPHYNIIMTSTRELSSANSHNLNVDVQKSTTCSDIDKEIDYSFKTFFKPKYTKCIEFEDYYIWYK